MTSGQTELFLLKKHKTAVDTDKQARCKSPALWTSTGCRPLLRELDQSDLEAQGCIV